MFHQISQRSLSWLTWWENEQDNHSDARTWNRVIHFLSFSLIERPAHNEQPASYKETGGRLNKKDGLTRYGNSHVKDKTS